MKLPYYSVPSVVASLALALSGCNADGSPPSPRDSMCNAQAAQGLVGKAKPTDVQALQVTGSKTVRQIAPGDMVTQDFREDRVTVTTDPSSGLVVAASCG